MQDGVTEQNLRHNMAGFYQQADPDGAVALVLGAGNVSAIVPLDVLDRMINCGQVVICKMNCASPWHSHMTLHDCHKPNGLIGLRCRGRCLPQADRCAEEPEAGRCPARRVTQTLMTSYLAPRHPLVRRGMRGDGVPHRSAPSSRPS